MCGITIGGNLVASHAIAFLAIDSVVVWILLGDRCGRYVVGVDWARAGVLSTFTRLLPSEETTVHTILHGNPWEGRDALSDCEKGNNCFGHHLDRLLCKDFMVGQRKKKSLAHDYGRWSEYMYDFPI